MLRILTAVIVGACLSAAGASLSVVFQNPTMAAPDIPGASVRVGFGAALAKEGYTVIQTTYNPEHSYMFSDRIVAIRDSKVLMDGTLREVVTSETMSALYGTAIKTVSLEDDRVRVCFPETL